jgi:hypothetical protein
MIPTSQVAITTDNFITFINEEMSLGVLPHILSYHENNLTRSELVPVTSGTLRYQVPHRAIGNKLKDLYIQDSSGSLSECTRINDGELADFNGNQNPYPRAFYPEGDSVVLLHDPGTSSYLKFVYHMRPNQIVAETRAAKITDISAGLLTVDTIPSVFLSGLKYDIVKSTSPYNCVAVDIIPTAITTSSITFSTSDLPSTLKIGDYINLAEETIIPQVPPELHSLLVQRVVARCLEALGDLNGLQAANAKIAEMEVKTGSLIDNRVENAPQKIKNRWSVLRSRRWW